MCRVVVSRGIRRTAAPEATTPPDRPISSAAGRRPVRELVVVWFVAGVIALVHDSILTVTSSAVSNPLVDYLVLVGPALVLLFARPKPTLRRGYRWVALWAVCLLSTAPTPVLLIGEAWVLGRTWIERNRVPRSATSAQPARADLDSPSGALARRGSRRSRRA